MFLFEKLAVYQKALRFSVDVYSFLKGTQVDRVLKDQLQRASTSIALNIAEGSGRFTQKDKNHFFVNARGSAQECVAIIQLLCQINCIPKSTYDTLYSQLEELAKMLSGLIKHTKDK